MWVTAGDLFAPLDVPLEIKLGLSRGTTCDAIETTSGRPRFQAHIGRVLAAGSYCIELTDTDGLLPETAGVIARIVHPPPTSVPNPATVSSASVIQPGGSASLSFEVQSPGTVTATLRDLSIDAPAGLGMGLVNPEGTECLPSQAKVVSAGSTPHFSVPVDPGRYCVAVFDVGNFQAPTTYTLEVAHP